MGAKQFGPGRVATENLQIAVLIPCHNEQAAIATVVRDFRAVLPDATIHVYDNNSDDGTAEAARAAGALVGMEPRQGKGHVVRRMFADIEADIYLLVDGDATYDAASAPSLISDLIENQRDMVIATRIDQELSAYRRGRRTGNRLLTGFMTVVFRRAFADTLSGYRVFSRRFVKSFPGLSAGFEIETELTVHALVLELPVGELETPYYARPEGTQSKLNTWRDGFRILWMMFRLYRAERPLMFFSSLGVLFGALSISSAIPLFATYLHAGQALHLPTAVLSTGLMMIASLSILAGLILDNITRARRELKLLAYLEQPAIGSRNKTNKG